MKSSFMILIMLIVSTTSFGILESISNIKDFKLSGKK